MSYVKCTLWGHQEFKDYSNPNIHYSSEENNTANFKCSSCLRLENLKVGDWYQDKEGNYLQKEEYNEKWQ